MKGFSFTQAIIEDERKASWLVRLSYAKALWETRHQVQGYRQEASQVVALIAHYQEQVELIPLIDHYRALARTGGLSRQREHLYHALALLCCVSDITLSMIPYEVQIMSVLAMFDGRMVQLAPGEGKTLTIGVTAVLYAWQGKPCHVITSNDYLAGRDLELMKPLFSMAGVSGAHVVHELTPEQKIEAYSASIVYGTAKQFLADSLSDFLKFGQYVTRQRLSLSAIKGEDKQILTRGVYAAIVDEADSVLVDDATTPLIISAPQPNPLLRQAIMIAKSIVDSLEPEVDYKFYQERSDVEYFPSGEVKVTERMSELPKLWHSLDRLDELLLQAIMARDVFKLDQHYIIEDGEVIIVDEGTGRVMPGRSWSYGLHQAIEARAGVELTDPSQTMARLSFQTFFKSYHRLCGASGTLQDIGFELFYNYKVLIAHIPTRLPSQLKVTAYLPYHNQEEKWDAVIEFIDRFVEEQRPVLIGTRRITDSEKLASLLEDKGYAFNLLNAKFLAKEAEIVANAGVPSAITVATNMAGRGTDIKVAELALAKGGLVVIMVEPYESARVDWQLFGRSGRQGQVGNAYALVALDDKLLKDHLPFWAKQILKRMPEIGIQKLITQFVKLAQRTASKKAFKQRQTVTQFIRDNRDRLSFTKVDG